MKMKNSKSRNEVNKRRFDDYEEDSFSKKKDQHKRRPVRNWTKIVREAEAYDDLEEFYEK